MLKQSVIRRHILVIDDDELVTEYLGVLLEAQNYEVTVFNEPVAALSFLQEHLDDFDLIITDQLMPGLTGIEVTAIEDAISTIEKALGLSVNTCYSIM